MIDDNPIRAYKGYEINTEIFQAMGVEPPPKCVNGELNSHIDIRGQNSHLSESKGAPPTSMLLWGAAHCVKYIIVMQMTVHAQKGLLRQLDAALPLLSRRTAVERHYRPRGAALLHLLQQHRSNQAPHSRLYKK